MTESNASGAGGSSNAPSPATVADDDTLIRPASGFYGNSAAGGSAPAVNSTGAADQPTLAERIMHRLPAPPEKESARKEYEEKQASQEAERQRALERLQAEEDEAAAETSPFQRTSADSPSYAPSPAAAPAPATAVGTAPATAVGPAPAAAVAPAPGPAPVAAVAPAPVVTPNPAPVTAAQETLPTPRPRRTRKARLRVSRVDPWSVMKTFFLFAIAGGIMFFTAAALIYTVVETSGLFDQVDELVGLVFDTQTEDSGFQIRQILSWERVMGVTALLACVNVIILTALATLGSFLYNLAATMLGGFEVTLAED